MSNPCAVLVLGGAGFVGSNIACLMARHGHRVAVLDGLLPNTGGRSENLESVRKQITFLSTTIEETERLAEIVAEYDCVVDAMAWTSHQDAMRNPVYDLTLNARSHLALFACVPALAGKKLIFLGSRGQYGDPKTAAILDDTAMLPEDIQGIHKVAAESYFRVFSKCHGLDAVALRFPNCFGRCQRTTGSDIGLVGSFIRDALAGHAIEVYGASRTRCVVYAQDVANVVSRLCTIPSTGFQGFNMSGQQITIKELAATIVRLVGRGTVVERRMPQEISAIEMGDAVMNQQKLMSGIGRIPKTSLDESLTDTIAYFNEARA